MRSGESGSVVFRNRSEVVEAASEMVAVVAFQTVH